VRCIPRLRWVVQLQPISNKALVRGDWSATRSGHSVPTLQEVGWDSEPVWTGKSFDPETVQSAVNGYTD
jgi:hypothetical protein